MQTQKKLAASRSISQTLQRRIIPDLLARKRALVSDLERKEVAPPQEFMASPEQLVPSQLEVERFAANAMNSDDEACIAICDAWLDRGMLTSDLFLGLMTEAARRMGEQWVEDSSSFADVTLGTSFLHGLMRRYSPDLAREFKEHHQGRSICFSPVLDSAHIFGRSMVEEFFRAAKWDVHSDTTNNDRDMLALLRSEVFDIVGVSIGTIQQVAPCKALVAQIRKVSKNKAIAIMVGGPPFLLQPELVEEIGADATARDAREAVAVANELTGKSRP